MRPTPTNIGFATSDRGSGQTDMENPIERICTSHVERSNGTMRGQIRRLTRLTYAFSKNGEPRAALALYFAWYNWCHRVIPSRHSGNGSRNPITSGRSPNRWRSHDHLRMLAERLGGGPTKDIRPCGRTRPQIVVVSSDFP